MKFTVHELGKAQADIRSITHWLAQRSPQGAKAWLQAYDEMILRLEVTIHRAAGDWSIFRLIHAFWRQ